MFQFEDPDQSWAEFGRRQKFMSPLFDENRVIGTVLGRGLSPRC